MNQPDVLAGVHPEIAHLSWLVGRWTGFGVGTLPDGSHFRYEELVEFASDGRPFLEYRSQTWITDDDGVRMRASHTESGYWRPAADNGVEGVICNQHGIAEVWIGKVTVANIVDARITAAKLEVHQAQFVHTPGAPRIASGTRLYGIRDGKLFMAFDMAVPGSTESSHAAIELRPA